MMLETEKYKHHTNNETIQTEYYTKKLNTLHSYLERKCNHRWIHEWIEKDVEKGLQEIKYCVKCETTYKL